MLGPNGAGNTTLLRLLAGDLRARSGQVSITKDGQRSVSGSSLRRQVAWMPQSVSAVAGLNVLEQVAYSGWLGGLPTKVAMRRADGAVRLVLLDDGRDAAATTLSGGQLRRVGLADALAMRADYLLLDEPMAGLDPAQRANFREVLKGLPDCGLVVSTHQTDDVADETEFV